MHMNYDILADCLHFGGFCIANIVRWLFNYL